MKVRSLREYPWKKFWDAILKFLSPCFLASIKWIVGITQSTDVIISLVKQWVKYKSIKPWKTWAKKTFLNLTLYLRYFINWQKDSQYIFHYYCFFLFWSILFLCFIILFFEEISFIILEGSIGRSKFFI